MMQPQRLRTASRNPLSYMREVSTGTRFERLGSILLFFACLGLVGGGLVRILPDRAHAPVGWVMIGFGIGFGFVLTYATVGYWGRILPGVFGLGGVNALIALWSGHHINQPSVAMPADVALVLAVVFFAAAFLSGRIADREFGFFHTAAAPHGFRVAANCNAWESIRHTRGNRRPSVPIRSVAAPTSAFARKITVPFVRASPDALVSAIGGHLFPDCVLTLPSESRWLRLAFGASHSRAARGSSVAAGAGGGGRYYKALALLVKLAVVKGLPYSKPSWHDRGCSRRRFQL